MPGMALPRTTTRRTFAKAAAAPLVVSASTLGLGEGDATLGSNHSCGHRHGKPQPAETSKSSSIKKTSACVRFAIYSRIAGPARRNL